MTSKLRKIEKGHSHKTKGQDNPWAEDAGEASEAGEDSETEEKTLQREVIEQQADSMFKTLKLENREKKTPLHLAVDKNQLWLVLKRMCKTTISKAGAMVRILVLALPQLSEFFLMLCSCLECRMLPSWRHDCRMSLYCVILILHI